MRERSVNKCLPSVERCHLSARVEPADRRGEEVAGTGQATTIVPGSYKDRIGEAADVPDLAGVSLLGEPRLFSERRSKRARHPPLHKRTIGGGSTGLRGPRGRCEEAGARL